jgi:multiple sugar transport system substrate-binding protein
MEKQMMRSQYNLRIFLSAALLSIVSIGTVRAVELTIWHHTYPPAEDFIKQKAAEFTKLNPEVTFKFESNPHGDYEVKLFAAFAGGNAPDIILASWCRCSLLASPWPRS